MEKKKESHSGMEIMNLLQKEGRQRGTWTGKKAGNDFSKMIVDAYEVKKQELMQENSDLQALLCSIQGDMREFLNAQNGLSEDHQQTPEANGRQNDSPQTPLGGKMDMFDLPFHMEIMCISLSPDETWDQSGLPAQAKCGHTRGLHGRLKFVRREI